MTRLPLGEDEFSIILENGKRFDIKRQGQDSHNNPIYLGKLDIPIPLVEARIKLTEFFPMVIQGPYLTVSVFSDVFQGTLFADGRFFGVLLQPPPENLPRAPVHLAMSRYLGSFVNALYGLRNNLVYSIIRH